LNEKISINKNTLPIGVVLIIIGFCILGVMWYYLRGEQNYWYEWQKEITRTYGYLATPLWIIAHSLLITGFVMVGLYLYYHLYLKNKGN